MKEARKVLDVESLLGIEGNAAKLYFSVFQELILQNKKEASGMIVGK